jgi:hypothetical protein
MGIRNPEAAEKNVWNDVLITATDELVQLCHGTTDPGKTAAVKHRVRADHLQIGYH